MITTTLITTAFFVSLAGAILAIAGGLLLLWKENLARKFSVHLVAFAAGTLLATSLLDLVPEAVEMGSIESVMALVVVGFLAIFILEKFFVIYHCHDGSCDVHGPEASNTFIYTILVGDTLHNFMDGIAIAIAFTVDINLGIATAIAVFAHEFPQEIGDMGVLLHGGLSRMKVLAYNVVSALAAPAGTLVGFLIFDFIQPYQSEIMAFIAGTFLYIAASDLIPHLKEEWEPGKSAWHISLLLMGVVIIWLVLGLHHHG